MAYLTTSEFELRTIVPAAMLVEIETVTPGWLEAQLLTWSRWIDARLAKRYATPFGAPYPETVCGWLERLVAYRCYMKRGVDPNDQQIEQIKADRDAAMAEIAEAANAVDGLFELPLREETPERQGITKGAPIAYAEASPYVGFSKQARTGRDEDANGDGTYG